MNIFRKRQTAEPTQGSIKKQVVSIVSIFITVAIMVFALAYFQSEVMNAVRAYVRGEGLWAKSQKDAIIALQSYAITNKAEDYERFQNALKIPMGDKSARIALEADEPNEEKALAGFIEGQNSQEDAKQLIWFFIWFQEFPYMSEAIEVWREADASLLMLESIGKRIHQAKLNGDESKIRDLLVELNKIDQQLAKLEYEFSSVLSEGAVWVKQTSLTVTVLLLIIMLSIVLTYSRRVIRVIDKKEKALLVSENRFKSLYESDMIGIFEWHMDGRIFEANDAFLKMIGFNKKDLIKGELSWKDLSSPDSENLDTNALDEVSKHGSCKPYEKEFVNKSGQHVTVLVGGALLGGQSEKGIAFTLDLTEKRNVEEEVRLLASVFNSSGNGALVTDRDFNIVTVNQHYLDSTGFKKNTLIGKRLPLFNAEKMSENQLHEITEKLEAEGRYQGDVFELMADGNTRPILLSINGIYNARNQLTHYAFFFTDIKERKMMEEKLKQMAHYDPLTGLANRSLLQDRHTQALIRAERNKKILALLFLDLDNFKPINDEYGHEIGDKLLKEVASRLNQSVRNNDSVARLGGDEFVILLEDMEEATLAGDVADKIISRINEPFVVNGLNLNVGCSIGICIFPDDARTVDDMMRYSDIAMYAAKASGRNSYYYFNPKIG